MLRPSPLVLALVLTAAGCGGDREGASGAALPSGIRAGDLEAAASPGVPLAADGESPVLWLATPTAELAVTNERASTTRAEVRLANLASGAHLDPTTVAEREGTSDGECGQQTRSCNCSTATRGRCEELCSRDYLELEHLPGARADVTASLPGCLVARFRADMRPVIGDTLTLGIVGRTGSIRRTMRAIDQLPESVDLAMLLGDHLGRGDEPESLGRRVRRDVDIPVVATPGEREVKRDSTRPFRRVFGPRPTDWRLVGVQFATVTSPRRTLGPGGVQDLADRLTRLGRTDGPLVLATHTPPFDPVAPRDAGYTSRLEAARAASLVTRHGTDLMLAGHLGERERARVGPTGVIVAAAPDRARYTLVSWPADPDDGADPAVDRRTPGR